MENNKKQQKMIKNKIKIKKSEQKCAYCGHPRSEHNGSGHCNHKSHRNLINVDYYCKCTKFVEEVE